MQKYFIIIFLSTAFTNLYSKDYRVERMSDSINSSAEEYWPTISADGKTLIFNRLTENYGLKNEDFYYSTLDNLGEWTRAKPLKSLNTEDNEGAQSLSADGRFMVFTSCNSKDSYGSCDLYYSFKVGEEWLPPRNLGSSINTRDWETQPSLSPDGTELYFVSNRKGGKGGMDIWHSKLIGISENGEMQWSNPTNLEINTLENEVSPFIHSDNETLYFSSNGYTKEKQFDIFISRKTEEGFSSPTNIDSLINTSADEIGFVVNASGNTAYFSSDREGKDKDIYTFQLPARYRPKEVIIVKGKVLSSKTNEPLFTTIKVQSIGNSTSIYNTITNIKTGEFLLCLLKEKKWRLSAQTKDYFFHTENLDFTDVEKNTMYQNIKLQPIEIEAQLVLKNIFFDTDKSILKPISKIELENIKILLETNPSLKVEISGHTDNQGSEIYNKKLSKARAQSVYTWLVDYGIEKERLSAIGYGEEKPIATNKTPEGRAQNRRTELKVVSF